MNILLTSVGRRSYLVKYFKKALGHSGEIHVSNSSSLTPAFMCADQSVITPLIYDNAYVPFLMEYCKNNKIDVIISLFDIDLPILSKNKNDFLNIGVKVIVSDEEVVEICNDKYLTYSFLKNNGFNTPRTFLNIDDVIDNIINNKLQFPLIIKPRWGMGSIGVLQADNLEELKVFYKKTLREINDSYLKYESGNHINESIVIQEKLMGQEYGLDIINNLNREYQNTIVKVKHAMRSGETDCAEVVESDYLKKIGEKLSQKLKHISNADVDVFLVDGKAFVLEINARFGGGYPFTHAAGVNLPEAIIRWSQNKVVPKELLQEEVGILAHKDISITYLEPCRSHEELKISIRKIENSNQVVKILNDFDKVFSPSISEKINDKMDYAIKILENGHVYLAENTKSMAFISFYANDSIKKISYITFLGVKKDVQNMKLGKKLLRICYDQSIKLGMTKIMLEVQKKNKIAINFYEKNGFSYYNDASENSYYMIKDLRGEYIDDSSNAIFNAQL